MSVTVPPPRAAFEVPPRVVVLAGGGSPEREISLQSGQAVSTALRQRGHEVIEVDPVEDSLAVREWSPRDVVFLALHGPGGEDGIVQCQLEQLGVPYTGCDAAASRTAFSKSAAKQRFRDSQVATPEWRTCTRGFGPSSLSGLFDHLGTPLIVKPDAQGSSLGVSLVESPAMLSTALSECFRLGRVALLEQVIRGEEWTVAFLGEDPLPPTRITSARPVFDFDAKYLDEGTVITFPEVFKESVGESVLEIARRACQTIPTRGIVRVDVRVDLQGRPWILEINTIPGLTDHSLVPRAAAVAGLSLGELCERALAEAIECHRRKIGWQIPQNRSAA